MKQKIFFNDLDMKRKLNEIVLEVPVAPTKSSAAVSLCDKDP